MSRLITLLGVIAAVAAVIATDVQLLNPKLGIYITLAGTAAAAAGRELVNPAALRRGLPRRGAAWRGARRKGNQ